MKISKIAIALCLGFLVNHGFAAQDVEERTTTTTTETPEGVTTTQTTEDFERRESKFWFYD